MGMTGPDGQAVDTTPLGIEIATPTASGRRRVYEEQVAARLRPERLGQVMRDAARGETRAYLTLAEEMEERYLHYASQLQTRRLALDGIEPSVEVPDGVPAAIGDFVHELVEDPAFGIGVAALADGISKGYSVVEQLWEMERKRLRPVNYVWRDPRFFRLDRLTLSDLRLEVDGSAEGEPLPAAKFIRHVPRIRTGIPSRTGLARPAAWAFMVQQFSLQDWAAFAEKYGVPFLLGTYPRDASEAVKREFLRGLAQMANDGAGIMPDGAKVEAFKVDGAQGEAVFGGLLAYVDRQVSKLVVGQTMTADSGSSMAQAKIHNEVRLDILRSDAKQTAITVNRDVIEMAVALNFGPQERYPKVIWPVAEPEDVTAIADGVAKLVPLGLKVSQRELRSKFGLSEPEADEDILAPAAAPAPAASPAPDAPPAPVPGRKAARLSAHVTGCRCGGCLRTALLAAEPATEPDGVDVTDQLLEEMLADWQDITDPILQPLLAAVTHATSLDEVLVMLRANGPDASKLAERLAIATMGARAIGDAVD